MCVATEAKYVPILDLFNQDWIGDMNQTIGLHKKGEDRGSTLRPELCTHMFRAEGIFLVLEISIFTSPESTRAV